MTTNQNQSRDRRPPDDVRLELFVPGYVPENPFAHKQHQHQQNNNTNHQDSAQQVYLAICDETVRRFRSWKTKYFQLIRAIEWCLPDLQSLQTTIQRVRKYNTVRYTTYFELDGSDLDSAKDLSGSWTNEMMSKLLVVNSASQTSESSLAKQSETNDHQLNGLALLVVFGTAADQPAPCENPVGPNQPPNTADLYEKKKKIRVEDIKEGKGANKSFFKTVPSTSRSLKGFLIKNITDPDVLDAFIQRHLLRLMIQMKMMTKSPEFPAHLLKAFVPIVYEPVRRCASVIAIGEIIFVLEPFLCFKETICSCLKALLKDQKTKYKNIELVVLGEARDAVLLSIDDLQTEMKGTLPNTVKIGYHSSQNGGSRFYEFSQQNEHKIVLSIESKSNNTQNILSLSAESCPDNAPASSHCLLSFCGDFLSLDSKMNNNGDEKEIQHYLGGVIGTFAQQQEREKLDNERNKSEISRESNREYLKQQRERGVQVTNDTLLVPSHGGYSWVTKQLDLSWAGFAYLTNKTLFPQPLPGSNKNNNNNNAASSSSSSAKTEPKVVASGLHAEIQKVNRKLMQNNSPGNNHLPALPVLRNLNELKTLLPFSSASFGEAMFNLSVPLILDTRSPSDFECCRIAGSLSIPFALQEPARSSKKAELWLSQLLVPNQKLVLVLPSGEENGTMVLERICSIVPASLIGADEKLQLSGVIQDMDSFVMHNYNDNNKAFIIRGQSNKFSSSPSYETVSKIVKESAEYFSSSQQQSSFVIDCRTPIEFAQGSHVASANIPLADFRHWLLFHCNAKFKNDIEAVETISEWNAKQNEEKKTNSDENQSHQLILPSRYELFLEKKHDEASSSNHHHMFFHQSEIPCFTELEKILFSSSSSPSSTNANFLIYCAAGYRSRIFMSIFESALLALEGIKMKSQNNTKNDDENNTNNQSFSNVTVADVGRGAIELMSQHAELWTVKDRGIVCVS